MSLVYILKMKKLKIRKMKDVCLNEDERNLQEVYDALLEDCNKYAKVANNAVKKMKKVEEEYKYTLV